MEAIFMNTENRQTSEPQKFSQVKRPKLVTNIRHKNKHVALQNLSTYYTWKNIRKHYKSNKLKIVAPT